MPTYRESGVDIDAGQRLVEAIGPSVTQTWGPDVLGGFGGFAAGIRIPAGYQSPVLMMTTDGVGTKLEVARRAHRMEGIGFDLVAMCVDDLAAVGARPIGFTDYLAVGKLDPARDEALVASIAEACSVAGCALLGGETAEHPGVVATDHVDVAGAALGVVEEGHEVTGTTIRPGDLILGVHSPNLRSNGFSLVRAIVDLDRLEEPFPKDERSWGEVLTDPSVVYAPAILDALACGNIHGLAHITGGGLPGNIKRVLPNHVDAHIDTLTWEPPNVFTVLAKMGGVSAREMFGTFNMGIGFVTIVDRAGADEVEEILALHGHTTTVIGEISTGEGLATISNSG